MQDKKSRPGARSEGKNGFEDVWVQITKKQAADMKKNKTGKEANVLFVGGTGTGKSMAIQAFLSGQSGKKPEPTTSLDYRFLHFSSKTSKDRQLAHIWELGGGRSLAKLMDIAINTETVRTTMVVCVVDLSNPKEALSDIDFWINAIRRRVSQILEKVSVRYPQVPRQMAKRAQKLFGEGHADINALSKRLSAVPLLIVGMKYDKFKNSPTEKLRVAARTFRSLAHCNGASLIYVDKDDRATKQALRAHITRFMNGGGKLPAPQMNDISALNLVVGQDSLKSIGVASAIPVLSPSTLLEEWQTVFKTQFATSNNIDKKDVTREVRLNPEPGIDSMLEQMNLQAVHKARKESLSRRMNS